MSIKYTVMQNAMTDSERVFSFLDADDMIPETATAYQGPKTVGHIRFDNVTFGYD